MVKLKVARGLIRCYISTQSFLIGLKRWSAWTSFWNTIYFYDEKSMRNKKLIKHEMQHIKQYKREGRLKFTFKHIYFQIRYGYWENPYEIEARKVAGQPIKKKV